MKYKKGAKVEVLNKREVPSASWWCAEIISGNGHTYSVKYDPSPPGMSGHAERVPRKVIRPRPPLVQGPTSWVPGDIAEIFDNISWKLAEVLTAVDQNHFLVRLLGSSTAFKVHKSDLRLRQCWQDNRWVVIGKDVRSSNDELLMEGFRQGLDCQKTKGLMKLQKHEESAAVENNEKSRWVYNGGKKRTIQYCSSIPESCCRDNKKPRTGDKEGTCRQLAVVGPYHLQQKVDAVICPPKMLGERCMPTSLNNRVDLSEMDMEGRNPSGDMCCFTRCLEPSDASDCSSSGSNDLDMQYHYPLTGDSLDRDNLSDDADSSSWSKNGTKSIPTEMNLASKIHKLELYAYRTTMEALYSHGSITWEQEELMTNLRLELHISNDEHLLELRHLSSSKSDLLSYADVTPQSL